MPKAATPTAKPIIRKAAPNANITGAPALPAAVRKLTEAALL